MEPILNLKNISKSFPGVKALNDVSIDLFPGEVHVIIGENGAGKSTLMKILTGVNEPDEGSILINSKEVAITHPNVAEEYGVRMIYQEFNLIPELSVAKNIFLGHEITKPSLPFVIDVKKMNEEAERILSDLHMNIDPTKSVKTLGVGEQQMVEIAKALSENASIVIFDEPTSSLTDQEIKQLFLLIQHLREKKVGMFYISHRLEELFEVGDRVTVMRDGNVIDTKDIKDVTINELITKIANRTIDNLFPHVKSNKLGPTLLEVKDLCGEKFRDISFSIRRGEIVGLSGLVGAGRTELARAIFGIDRYTKGTVRLNGELLKKKNPKQNVKLGLSLLPEDRKTEGLALGLSIKENMAISSLQKYHPKGVINNKLEKQIILSYVDKLQIATNSIKKIVKQLSGGTQQKVVVSKWLLNESDFIIFDEPTRGIDVAAKTEIYKIMDEIISEGAGILMISSDLPEVLGMSDRVLVMHKGNLVAELETENTSQAEVLRYAFGQGGEGNS